MNRIPIVAANWKMNTTLAEARTLVVTQLPGLRAVAGVQVVLCPPFVSLQLVGAMLVGTDVGLGAQNLYWKSSGAYTGEVSAPMLVGLCSHVIVGHSERRQVFGETDETVALKLRAALEAGLTPIVCVGERLEERDAGRTSEVVSRQVRAAYSGLSESDARRSVIAYEPVWAIGTGRASTGADANAVIARDIRGTLAKGIGDSAAQAIRVQYGGSVTSANIAEFMSQPEVDGALVGGASLKADFVEIVKAAAASAGVGG